MAQPTAVINVVGLTGELLAHAPRIRQRTEQGRLVRLRPVLPAVTCSVQASMLTGKPVRDHGIVGNGWYDRTLNEVQFWKQSNRLVQAEKVWETARWRDLSVTCANLCWWYNMASNVDYALTPRPIYKADGRKIPDCHTQPMELRDELQAQFGQFPLFHYWGPAADIRSSEWIAAASKYVYDKYAPTLTLIYLPHLDYCLQKLGPGDNGIAKEVEAIDAVAGDLLDYFDERGVRVIMVSEYGIEPVSQAVAVNKALREAGMLQVRVEQGLEILDPAGSDAFAVADHQVAHIYTSGAKATRRAGEMMLDLPGVDRVLDGPGKAEMRVDHDRAGDLMLTAEPGKWFSYDYWLDDQQAPDFARTVDIHRKPGYDPRELFIDPAIALPQARVAWKLLRKKLGFRQLMDVIPLDTSLVRGSHGRINGPAEHQPILILPDELADLPYVGDEAPCEMVRNVILASMFEEG